MYNNIYTHFYVHCIFNSFQRAIEDYVKAKKQKGTLIDKIT